MNTETQKKMNSEEEEDDGLYRCNGCNLTQTEYSDNVYCIQKYSKVDVSTFHFIGEKTYCFDCKYPEDEEGEDSKKCGCGRLYSTQTEKCCPQCRENNDPRLQEELRINMYS